MTSLETVQNILSHNTNVQKRPFMGRYIGQYQYFKNFKSCFLRHYQKYGVFCAIPFFQKPQKSGIMS